MRILAIGDIHGCSYALDVLLAAIELRPDDTIVTLGDYIDRGADSKGVIERLIALSNTHHLVALRGNHEQMMLDAHHLEAARPGWIVSGGSATLTSYGGLQAVPESHWKFLENQCMAYWESERHFFVHAGVYPDKPLWDQSEYVLYWARFQDPIPHESGKIMVCGHTTQQTGLPSNLGHAICIDTWACGRGWLSCLDVTTGTLWQANQLGRRRQLQLDNLLATPK